MATTFPNIAIPGQPLAFATSYTPGTGVHVFNDQICASIVGQPQLSTPASPSRKEKDQEVKQVLSVLRPASGKSEDVALVNLLPQVGSMVLARVTRINPRQATVEIFVVGDTVSNDEFQGIIRQQDVRATEKDKVRIFSSFRPGDIVRAQVISLGDQSNYYLSTASNSLGVVVAHSDSGDPLHPLNWRQMASSRTGAIEERKVAKPI
ncbi:exosome 3'-_5 exonuclease subunit ski4 (Csl4) [Maublancomyces gigas]|uniref:Exosome 3'->5 exonuclease subunit ski4 (Csl4) n=1 Tax=Discina gigas TaxID=1032678 RepID=A0ABR3GCC2_9PEZI